MLMKKREKDEKRRVRKTKTHQRTSKEKNKAIFSLLVTVETRVHRAPIKVFLLKTTRGHLPHTSYESCNGLPVTFNEIEPTDLRSHLCPDFTVPGSEISLMKTALGSIPQTPRGPSVPL